MFKWWWCGYITVKQIKSNKFILYLPSLSLGKRSTKQFRRLCSHFFADASIKKVLIKRREMLLLWWPLGSHISKKYPLEILLNLSKGSVAVMAFIIKNFIIIWKWKKRLIVCWNVWIEVSIFLHETVSVLFFNFWTLTEMDFFSELGKILVQTPNFGKFMQKISRT